MALVDTIQPLIAHPVDWLMTGLAGKRYALNDGRWGWKSKNPALAPDLEEGDEVWQFRQYFERALGYNAADNSIAGAFAWYWPHYNQAGNTTDPTDPTSYYNEVKTYMSIIYGFKPGFAGTGENPGFVVAVRLPDGVVEPVPEPSYAPQPIKDAWVPEGGSTDLTYPSGGTGNATNLPMPLSALATSTLVLRGRLHFYETPRGKGHIAYDMFLQKSSPQTKGFADADISHEIMIPLYEWGDYGAYGIRSPSWFIRDVTIDGVEYGLYALKDDNHNDATGAIDGGGPYLGVRYNFGGLNPNYPNEETLVNRRGWKFIVLQFKPTPANPHWHPVDANGRWRINYKSILQFLMTELDSRGIPLVKGDEWVPAIEIGAETIYGDAKYAILDYSVIAENTVVADPPWPTYSVPATIPSWPALNSTSGSAPAPSPTPAPPAPTPAPPPPAPTPAPAPPYDVLNPRLPWGFKPVIQGYSVGSPDGVELTDVGGGMPRVARAWDRGRQPFNVTLVLKPTEFTVWTAFFHKIIRNGSIQFTMKMDSGRGLEDHLVIMIPGTYNAQRAGISQLWSVSFTVLAESKAHLLSDTEALDMIEQWETTGTIPAPPAPPPAPTPAPTPAPAPLPPGTEGVLLGYFRQAGADGGWFDTDTFTRFRQVALDPATVATDWGQLIGEWLDRSEHDHNLREFDAANRGVTETVSPAVHDAALFQSMDMVNAGRAATFYFVACLSSNEYYGTFFHNGDNAFTGLWFKHTADYADTTGDLVLTIGTGAADVVVGHKSGAPAYTALQGVVVVETWLDGVNAGIRVNKGTPTIVACPPAALPSATATNLIMFGHNVLGDILGAKWFGVAFLKNVCPSPADRDAIATMMGARGGIVI